MKRNPFLIGAGSMIVVAALGIIAAPTAAHAIVATLVQVANTSSNPVMSLDVSRATSQMLTLNCQNTNCFAENPGGGGFANYTVPAGQTFVVTEVDIVAGNSPGNITNFNLQGNCAPICGDQSWYAPSDGATHQFLSPAGLPFPAGTPMVSYGSGGPGAFVRGYLTSF